MSLHCLKNFFTYLPSRTCIQFPLSDYDIFYSQLAQLQATFPMAEQSAHWGPMPLAKRCIGRVTPGIAWQAELAACALATDSSQCRRSADVSLKQKWTIVEVLLEKIWALSSKAQTWLTENSVSTLPKLLTWTSTVENGWVLIWEST